MTTQEEIYKTEGDKYEALIAREDHLGNILKTLREITPLETASFWTLGLVLGDWPACLLHM
ncbi:MAG: hypothetical protein IPJ47_16210 [Anaerolineales bacterium]|nr:hypothetical protein [Anaerolineales bacterium]